MTQPPVVTPNQVTSEKAILDVTPAWFEPVKTVSPDKIRLPTNYNENSPADVRTYTCLSSYRSMAKRTQKIDFVAEPFSSSVDNIETLIVVLNELAHQLGARLTFSHTDYQYNDSDYRTACGVTNLGSTHSLLASEGNFQTAKFNLHLTLDYNHITTTAEALRRFVLTFINNISDISQCNKDFIRVFSIKRVASILVEFGITTPQHDETIKVAESLKQKLNHVSTTKRRDLFHYMVPEQYDYKLEPALTFLQLQQSDFEPRYNRPYPNAKTETRGGRPYYHPQGWFRHALRVIDKYQGDEVWLGMNNSPGEWAVAYHGTKSDGARGIVDQGLLHRFVSADVCEPEAKRQYPGIPNVKGLYVATHCEGGASGYAYSFKVKESSGVTRNYQIVFQCRVQPGKFTEHTGPVRVGTAWRVFDEKAIRPYGLLLKAHK